MGFFSWNTADTNESISNIYSVRGALKVKMLDNKGNSYIEENYQGYGVFDGMDYYELLCEMNDVEVDRDKGISLYFSGKNIKKPKIVTIDCDTSWENLAVSPDCEYQGFFY